MQGLFCSLHVLITASKFEAGNLPSLQMFTASMPESCVGEIFLLQMLLLQQF